MAASPSVTIEPSFTIWLSSPSTEPPPRATMHPARLSEPGREAVIGNQMGKLAAC
jgi:hypothetical protein